MRKVVVIGGSAGAIEASAEVLRGLEKDFQAPLLLVIHTAEGGENLLPEVLQPSTLLKVLSPTEPQVLEAGKVYVAPPNRHLIVRDGCVLSVLGPRENRHRPAVDALFRSAARAYRADVVAVVLSGFLDDGVAGALSVQARGGTVVVQAPNTARAPDMPNNVLRYLKIPKEHCLPVEKISALLNLIARSGEPIAEPQIAANRCTQLSDEMMPIADPTAYTCPDCGGSLMKIKDGSLEQFRCNVGHVYTLENLSVAHSLALERAMWIALQRLNEQRSIQDHLAKSVENPIMQRRYHENAAAAAEDMRLLKEIIAHL